MFSNRLTKARIGAFGALVIAGSLFAVAAPAEAATSTRTDLTTSTPSISAGGTAKLKAVVKQLAGTLKPTGNVTFKEGTTTLATVPLALVGSVQAAKLSITTLAVGSHTIIATYAGSADFATSGSLPVRVTVAGGSKVGTTMKVTSNPATALPGQTVKVKAVVKAISGTAKPAGSVTFSEGTTTLGSAPLQVAGFVDSATLTITGGLSAGSHTITATYAGSATFNGSNGSVSITIGKATTQCDLSGKDGNNPGQYKFTVVVAEDVTGAATGIVTFDFDDLNPQSYQLGSTGRATTIGVPLDPRVHSIKVTYPGDTKFAGCTKTIQFTAA